MKKDALWKAYVGKNPKLSNDSNTITLTAKGFRKMFEQTYDIAYKRGKEMGKTIEDVKHGKEDAYKDFLNKMSGGMF